MQPELYTIATGAIAMLVIQALKRHTWPDAAKVLLTIAVSLVLGLAQWALQRPIGSITWQAVAVNTGEILAISTVLYKGLFQNIGGMVSLGERKVL
jgi:hypothetical protein